MQNSVEKWETYVNQTTIFSIKIVINFYRMWKNTAMDTCFPQVRETEKDIYENMGFQGIIISTLISIDQSEESI